MRLIAYEVGNETHVMQCVGRDRSDVAISAMIRKSGNGDPSWREITKAEYARIVASRVRVEVKPDAPNVAAPAPPQPSVMDQLALAVALASAALTSGVRAGDYRWHGGDDDFEWDGLRMDAPTLINHAKTVLGRPR